MPPSERTSSAPDGDDVSTPEAATPEDVLSLAEEAEAEAAEAEAAAAAARARARALRLRREAKAAAAASTAASAAMASSAPVASPAGDTERTAATDLVTEVPVATGADAASTTPEAAANATDADLTDADLPDASATDESPSDAESTPAADVDTRRRRFSPRRVPLRAAVAALAVVLTLGFIGAGGFMLWHHRQVVAEEQRSAEFAAAARQGVVTLMSLDFNRAQEDVQRILDNTTGDFRQEFAGQAENFTEVAQQSKVVTEATVNAIAVRSMTNDTANVLVAVTTRVSNAAANEQPPRSWRLSVDVARDGGQIKLAKVEFVP